MRVLLDLHHHALAESMLLLFEDRFGWECYFPAGREWFEAGLWQFGRDHLGPALCNQFLVGIWAEGLTVPDPRHPGRTHKGVTYAEAQGADWDLVVSSLPDNDPGYSRFARSHGAKFAIEVGNANQWSSFELADFLLVSTTLPGIGPERIGKRIEYQGVPGVMLHQEFDAEHIFYKGEPQVGNTVATFMQCFPASPAYPRWDTVAREAPDLDWRVYGSTCGGSDEYSAGNIDWVPDIADAMRDARVGWHDKAGDGFGHVIHNWFAVGRPVVGRRAPYANAIAGALWDEGKTAFDTDRLGLHETIALLRRLRDDDEWYARLCEQARWRFEEVVDFDAEAETVRRELEAVL